MAYVRRLAGLATLGLMMTSAVNAAPALWKVSDEDSSVWLFGSVHVLPKGTEWRTPLFDQILDQADKVYFETGVDAAAQPGIVTATMGAGMATDGILLTERIPADLAKSVTKVAHKYDLPMGLLLAMRPWFAAITISAAATAGSGFDPASGVDFQLQAELPTERKGYFETAIEQIGFLASADNSEGVTMLRATLDDLDETVPMMNDLIDAWVNGTPDSLGALFMEEVGAYGDGLMDRLVVQRNRNWADKIATMLADNEQALIVVGAGHLVDDVSVVKLLEAKDFTSERVQ